VPACGSGLEPVNYGYADAAGAGLPRNCSGCWPGSAGYLLGQEAPSLGQRSGQRLNLQGHVGLQLLLLQLLLLQLQLRLRLGQTGGNIDVQALGDGK